MEVVPMTCGQGSGRGVLDLWWGLGQWNSSGGWVDAVVLMTCGGPVLVVPVVLWWLENCVLGCVGKLKKI